MNKKSFSFGGGLLGLALFLFIGLLPSIVYGGFAGAVLAQSILGAPLTGQIISRVLVAFGMLIGLLATSSIFVVAGSAAGAGIYSLANKPAEAIAKKVLSE